MNLAPVFAAVALGISFAPVEFARGQEPPASSAPAGRAQRDVPEVFKQSLKRIASGMKDEAVARTLSFYLARLAALDMIAEKLPSLKERALEAKAKFSVTFGAGFDELLAEFLSRKTGGTEAYSELQKNVEETARKQPLDEAELAKAFEAGALKPEAQAFRYTHPLVVMHPIYQRHPERVLAQDLAATIPIATKDSPPVAMIRIPVTFGLISGKDAGETLNFAFASSGPATITLTFSPSNEPLTPEKAVRNLVNGAPPSLTAHAERARYVKTAVGDAALVPIDMTVESETVHAIGRGSMLMIPTPTGLIGITASVQVPKGPDQNEQADELLAHFEPLFALVRAGLIPATPPKPDGK